MEHPVWFALDALAFTVLLAFMFWFGITTGNKSGSEQ